MHIDSTSTAAATQTESRHSYNLCGKLARCGLVLMVLSIMCACSATQMHDHPAPVSAIPPSATADLDTQATAPPAHKEMQTDREQNIPKPSSEAAVVALEDQGDNGVALESGAASTLESPAKPEVSEAGVTPTAKTTPLTQPPTPPAVLKHYTVKGGENLYTIAHLPTIYADGMLWPLIYRANRDQIKNPRQIYPGQVLNIPRNISEPDKELARTTAKESTVFTSDAQAAD